MADENQNPNQNQPNNEPEKFEYLGPDGVTYQLTKEERDKAVNFALGELIKRKAEKDKPKEEPKAKEELKTKEDKDDLDDEDRKFIREMREQRARRQQTLDLKKKDRERINSLLTEIKQDQEVSDHAEEILEAVIGKLALRKIRSDNEDDDGDLDIKSFIKDAKEAIKKKTATKSVVNPKKKEEDANKTALTTPGKGGSTEKVEKLDRHAFRNGKLAERLSHRINQFSELASEVTE